MAIRKIMFKETNTQPKHPWCKKSCGQEFKKRPCLKRCEIKMGGQGLLLLMELKVLIMMTRLQNITVACLVMFCGLVIIIKTFNSINSRRPWPPILISHLFKHGLFLNSWLQLFLHQGCFGWDFISFLLLLPLFSFLSNIFLCNNVIWCAS